MPDVTTADAALRLLCAAGLGGALGLERELNALGPAHRTARARRRRHRRGAGAGARRACGPAGRDRRLPRRRVLRPVAGLANGDLADALIAFSPGFVAPPTQVGQPRVWVSHGTSDAVLPVERCGRRVVSTLTRAGHDTTYEEFAGGHVVPPHLVGAAFAWWLGESGTRH